MSTELLYTSAPKGLRHGSRGFCTVLTTAGMTINVIGRLEGISNYRYVYQPPHPQEHLNPVAYSHQRLALGGSTASVLSRVASYSTDYSGRSNKIAHHVTVEPAEMPAAGPAWLLAQRNVMRAEWQGQCESPASGPMIPRGDQQSRICSSWKTVAGDAGWGGVVAEAIVSGNNQPFWIIYPLEHRDRLLELIDESISLLPANQRWQATFNTFAANIPPDVECKIRFVPAGTEEAKFAASSDRAIDLTKAQSITTASNWVERARGVLKTETHVPLPSGAAGEEWDVNVPQQADEGPQAAWKSQNTPPVTAPKPSGPPPMPPGFDKKKNTPLIIGASVAGAILLLILTWGGARMAAGKPFWPGNEIVEVPKPPPPMPEPEPEPVIVEVLPVSETPLDVAVRYDQKQLLNWAVGILESKDGDEDVVIPKPVKMLGKLRIPAAAAAANTTSSTSSESPDANPDSSTPNSKPPIAKSKKSAKKPADVKLVSWGGESMALKEEEELFISSVNVGSNASGTFTVKSLPYLPKTLANGTKVYWSHEREDLIVVAEFDWSQSESQSESLSNSQQADQAAAYRRAGTTLVNLAQLFASVAKENKKLPRTFKLVSDPLLTRALRDSDSIIRGFLRSAADGNTAKLASEAIELSKRLQQKQKDTPKPLSAKQQSALLSIVADCGQISFVAKELDEAFATLKKGQSIDVPELKFHDSEGVVVKRIPLRFQFSW